MHCFVSYCCRDKNAFKTINAAPGSAVAKAAAASIDGGSNTADVFSRRHTQSKVYWATSKNKGAAAAQEAEKQQQLRRTSSSGAADVETLKGSLKKLDPAELIKVGATSILHHPSCILFAVPVPSWTPHTYSSYSLA
jgi:hypothetical protein